MGSSVFAAVLYRINRLKLFWFDDLSNYRNERSAYLRDLRERIEESWQTWELSHLDALRSSVRMSVTRCPPFCHRRVAPPSANAQYFRHEVSEIGYRRLLAIASSTVSLRRASFRDARRSLQQHPRHDDAAACGGVRRWTRLNRKHSTFFTAMLAQLNMKTEPEAYFDIIPWRFSPPSIIVFSCRSANTFT